MKKTDTPPIVRQSSGIHIKTTGGSDTYIKRDGSIGTAGKGALIQVDRSATLGVTQDQYVFVPIIKEKPK